MKTIVKLWFALMVLAALSPLGLIVPAYFKASAAWGEWSPRELEGIVGYIPQGLLRLSCLWSAPIPDYAFKGWERLSLTEQSVAYAVSGFIGLAIVVGIIVLIGSVMVKKDRP